MKVVIAGTYSQAGLGALQMQLMNSVRRSWMKCITLVAVKSSTISSATVIQILLQSLRFQAMNYIKEC